MTKKLESKLLIAIAFSITTILPCISDAGIYNLYHFNKDQQRVAPGIDDLGSIAALPESTVLDYQSLIQPFTFENHDLNEQYLNLFNDIDNIEDSDLITDFSRAVKKQSGSKSLDYSAALALEALWYIKHEAFKNALRPLEKSINIVDKISTVFDRRLVHLHTLLGIAQQKIGKYDRSQYHLAQAMSLLHRKQGTMTLQQIPLLYWRALNLHRKGQQWQSEQLLRTALRISRHQYGDNHLETLTPAIILFRHFREQSLSEESEYFEALSLFNDMRKKFADTQGNDTPTIAPLLREASIMHLLANNAEVDRGLRLQRDLVDLINKYPESFSEHEKIDSLLSLGDWLIMFDLEDEAADVYQQAWQMSQHAKDSAYWQELFTQPQLIMAGPHPNLSQFGHHYANRDIYGVMSYQVDKDGRPNQVKVTDTNMHGTVISQAQALFRLARFRPVIVNGKPQRSEPQEFVKTYNTQSTFKERRFPVAQRKTQRNRSPHSRVDG